MNRKNPIHLSYVALRRIIVGVVGASVCLVGVIMLVTPGPAIVVIPAGLAILSLEFAFARRWLKKLRERISKAGQDQRIRKM